MAVENAAKIENQDTHSAIPSWSGYDYQGKVAIYTVLSMINIMDIESEDMNKFTVEIEHLEDFSIKKNGYYQSIHQVKSYQQKYSLSSYKGAVLELLGKGSKYNKVKSAHLHTACQINSVTKEEVKKQIKEFNPDSKVEQFKEYKKLLFDENKFDEAYEKLFINDDDKTSFKRVIDITDIEDEIKNQIELFFEKNESKIDVNYAATSENINFIYSNLLAEIDRIVVSLHKNKDNSREIPFSVFIKILTEKNVFQLTPCTVSNFLKNELYKYFIEYCEENELSEEENAKELEVWYKNWQFVKELSDKDFLLICRKISPNVFVKNADSLSINDYRSLMNENGVKYSLFRMILELEHLPTCLKNIYVLEKNGVHHLITTIANSPGKNTVNSIGKKIFNNLKKHNDLLQLLYDINKMINLHLEGTFSGDIFEIEKAYQEEFLKSPNTYKENITRPKKIEFIKVDEAVEVLK
ncbi:ABC-three component system protein [Aeribacillus sp. FSL K6-2848]|uniref:ABC-three component system protein n=1 Tax=Aeribacillus sp. FSL K6-2848 TaxID=2954612 RepID=UPI0030FC0E21